MNHAAIVQHESQQPYRNRNYVLALLDDRHFDALNTDNHVSDLNGYCLDALDEIPAGCMRQFVRWPAQGYVTRGVSLAEQQKRDAVAERLIAELMAEESTTAAR